jgi:hypothetical protein
MKSNFDCFDFRYFSKNSNQIQNELLQKLRPFQAPSRAKSKLDRNKPDTDKLSRAREAIAKVSKPSN